MASFVLNVPYLVFHCAMRIGDSMIHFPKEMVSRSEKFGTVPVFHAAATKKKQTEIKHFNINNKNEKDSAPDLWSIV